MKECEKCCYNVFEAAGYIIKRTSQQGVVLIAESKDCYYSRTNIPLMLKTLILVVTTVIKEC